MRLRRQPPADWRAAGRVGEIERLAGRASAGRTDGAIGRHRQPAAAERLRRTGRVRILAGIEGIATAPGPARRAGSCTIGARISDLLLRISLLLLASASAAG